MSKAAPPPNPRGWDICGPDPGGPAHLPPQSSSLAGCARPDWGPSIPPFQRGARWVPTAPGPWPPSLALPGARAGAGVPGGRQRLSGAGGRRAAQRRGFGGGSGGGTAGAGGAALYRSDRGMPSAGRGRRGARPAPPPAAPPLRCRHPPPSPTPGLRVKPGGRPRETGSQPQGCGEGQRQSPEWKRDGRKGAGERRRGGGEQERAERGVRAALGLWGWGGQEISQGTGSGVLPLDGVLSALSTPSPQQPASAMSPVP